jgi:hypothetical protein
VSFCLLNTWVGSKQLSLWVDSQSKESQKIHYPCL